VSQVEERDSNIISIQVLVTSTRGVTTHDFVKI